MILSNPTEESRTPIRASRILAVSLGGVGDTVLFSPVLKALRLRYQNARIELLLASKLAECAYQDCEEIEKCHVLNLEKKNDITKSIEIAKFALKARKIKKYDIAVFATGLNPVIPKIIGNIGNIPNVYNAPRADLTSTDIECNIRLSRVFKNDISSKDIFFPVTNRSESEAENALIENHINIYNHTLIAVYPSTDLWHRPRWTLSKLLNVIRTIKSKEQNVRFVIIGSESDGIDWRKIDLDQVVDANLAGKLSISGTASLLRRCHLSICNDGGIMHVAVAVKSPVVAIMPNTPANYYPPGDKTKIIHPDLPCSVSCWKNRPHNCQMPICVDEIDEDQVSRACLKILSKN